MAPPGHTAWWVPLVTATALGSCASTATAGVFVPEAGAVVRPTLIEAVVTQDDASTQLVQTMLVDSDAGRFVWLKPFPSRPDIVVTPEVSTSDLRRLTRVQPPYNQAIRRDLFGPSVVSLLLRALVGRRDTAGAATETETLARRLRVVDYEIFDGVVHTSTITGQMLLPDDLQRWFRRRRYSIDERLKASIAAELNRGWFLVAVDVEDRIPDLTSPARVPAVRFRFASEVALLPLMRPPERYATEPSFDIWTLASRRSQHASYETVWSSRPWQSAEPMPSRFTAVFSRGIDADDPLADVLARQLELRLPPTPQLVRFRFRHGSEAWQNQTFVPAAQPVDIPGIASRASFIDVVLCLLLGLTPLVFTPESWFLMWLVARRPTAPRARAPRPNLWALYAIIVGVYWLATLEGLGRVAATVPILIGAGQLFWPAEPTRDEFVRVQFKRRAKPAN